MSFSLHPTVNPISYYIRITVCVAILAAAGCIDARSQIVRTDSVAGSVISSDSIRKAFDDGPYFGLYKDNYFIFGTSVGQRPTKENSNIKFQISISQRLTKQVMPLHSYLFLFYTQKCFWNVLENSMPMTDLNFNPGIGLAKPLFVKNRYIGPQVQVHAKFWIPIIDGAENKDILDYCGIYQVGTSFTTLNRRFGASVILTKRKGWRLNYNTIIELNYRIFPRDNQYLFLQYYNGYGEGLLAYKEFHTQLRVGIVIKPTLFSDY